MIQQEAMEIYATSTGKKMKAAGTSEGALKGWDARGRGRMTDQDHRAFKRATGRTPSKTESKDISNSVPHRQFMVKLARRAMDSEGNAIDHTYTKNETEHAMAKQLASRGHLKSAGGDGDRKKWNITLGGHGSFDLDQA